ncbi:MAG: hypothetical protein WCO84_03245 [bacterium]
MKKIIIVFDKFLFLRMFVFLNDGMFYAEYYSVGTERKEDENKIENLNRLVTENKVKIIGLEPEIGDKKSVFYTKDVNLTDPNFINAVEQYLTDGELFSKIIPEETKKMFLFLEERKLTLEIKKELYSKILNSNDDFILNMSNLVNKAEETFKK